MSPHNQLTKLWKSDDFRPNLKTPFTIFDYVIGREKLSASMPWSRQLIIISSEYFSLECKTVVVFSCVFFFLRLWRERESEKKRIFRVPPRSHSPFWKPVVSILVVSRRTQVKYVELFTTQLSKLVSKWICIETTGNLRFHLQLRPFPLTARAHS